MREILFRGKTVKTDEWVYGSLITGKVCSTIVNEHGKVLVKSETVGQYTNKDDVTGKKIFEGDLVKILNFERIGIRGVAREVEWIDFGYNLPSYKNLDDGAITINYQYQVVGNIYDGKEE